MPSSSKILLITPPFSQTNTPYPATAFLKGFLNVQSIPSSQADLGLNTLLRIFSKKGLEALFEEIDNTLSPSDMRKLSKNERRILEMRDLYINTIDIAIGFLQGKSQTLAQRIAEGHFLPQASHFNELEDMEWAFGVMGYTDKARHYITLYLEDLTDLINRTIDPLFGFSKYAEQMGRMAGSFDEYSEKLASEPSFIDKIMLEELEKVMSNEPVNLIGISIPFPGNLYSALRCGQYIKKSHPEIKITMGGGFASTELRSISDSRFFEYTDFLSLDDGERPTSQIIRFLDGESSKDELVRTFICEDGEVHYYNNTDISDFSPAQCGTPDYSGLELDKYLSVIEMVNPMHALWSNGRWNKLMLAHGCYWGKCAFCDGSLDYIGRYSPNSAKDLVDRMEQLIEQTGERGFHFIDEAAPPALLKELALEIINRRLTVVWWTNVRFEKSYTLELCLLLKQSGCIAVSGGLEVASDRLLKLINKGVTIEQVAKVTQNFTEADIMVHAYLMYGFPTETIQETIDSLEVVRQLFEEGLVHSAFWHRFALTAHSPVGHNPSDFNIKITEGPFGGFAKNDISYVQLSGDDPSEMGEGLRASLFNYMRGVGFDMPLHKWFSCRVPKTKIPRDLIRKYLQP